MWEIWYADGSVVSGDTEAEWNAAPADGVQVVVIRESYGAPHLSPWSDVWDRKPMTGVDEYSINGWSVKYGSLIDEAEYHAIWRRACGR